MNSLPVTRHLDIPFLLVCGIAHYFALTSGYLGPPSSYLAFILPSLFGLAVSAATGGTRRLLCRPYYTAHELPKRKVITLLAIMALVAYGLAFFDGFRCGEAYDELVFGAFACAERSISLRLIQRLFFLYAGHALLIQMAGVLLSPGVDSRAES